MTRRNSAVFGVFRLASQANKALDRLTSAGFSNSDVFFLETKIDGLLSSLGIPQSEATHYEGRLDEGGVLLAVHCDNSLEIDRANIILEQNGAEHISLPAHTESTRT